MVYKFDVNTLVSIYLYIFDFNIKRLYLIILKFNLIFLSIQAMVNA